MYLTRKLLVPFPESLLLKLKKSEFWSWPVLLILAKGRLTTRELPEPRVEVEMLKIVPAVPVETLLIKLAGRVKVKVWEEVEM